jgi:hypothetical protein
MSGAIHPLPQYAFMAWCLVKHRDNFTFTFTRGERKTKGFELKGNKDFAHLNKESHYIHLKD